MSSVYDFSIPVFIRALMTLKKFLQTGEKWCDDNNKPHSTLLEGKLADDMKPLPFQIHVCCTMAVHTFEWLAGGEHKTGEYNQKTFAQMYDRIDEALGLLRAAKPENFAKPDEIVKVNISEGWKPEIKSSQLLQNFHLPNFFFHEAMAYAILRHKGVPLGKADWLDRTSIMEAVV